MTIPFAQKLPDRMVLTDAWSAHLQTPVWKMKNTDVIRVQRATDPGAAQIRRAQIRDLPGYIPLENQPLVPLADDSELVVPSAIAYRGERGISSFIRVRGI